MKILIDGDSFAAGNYADGTSDGGIGPILADLLGPGHEVFNCAVPGATYAARAAAVYTTLATHDPDLVICIAGVNDAAAGNGGPVSAQVAAAVRTYADAVLQRRPDPNRVKLVIGLIPQTDDLAARPLLNIAIDTANHGVWSSWYQWGYATWVPVLYDLSGLAKEYLGPDKVHPTADGYRWMAYRIYEAIQVGGQIPDLPPLPVPAGGA
ncbi:MAG TPA: SGNH/GDSL hydrolase family protein [Actinoplanes sp.]|nr:SGNH/GDSL hydrolase family protein [Actinoplanes sp.]